MPNHFAKSLVSLKSHTIGLILHDVTNPILTSAAQTLQPALVERGYSVLFATSNGSYEEEVRAIEMFQTRMVDGILVYPLAAFAPRASAEAAAAQFPRSCCWWASRMPASMPSASTSWPARMMPRVT